MKFYTYLVVSAFCAFALQGPSAFADAESVAKIVSNVNSVAGPLFNQAASIPNFGNSGFKMSSAKSSCMSSVSSKYALKKTPKSSFPSCTGQAIPYDEASICKYDLKEVEPKACRDYFPNILVGEDKQKYDSGSKSDALDAWEKDSGKKKLQCYKEVAFYKVSTCGKAAEDEINKMYDDLNCEMVGLQAGLADATAQVNQIMQANNTKYDEMNQVEKELKDQKNQIDAILGPDPELGQAGGQMGGLLALQKRIQQALDGYKKGESDFTNAITQIKEDTVKNEQNLDSSAMGVVTSCMNGDRSVTTGGGKALLCSKPNQAIGSDGKPIPGARVTFSQQPCGPLEWVRAKVRESAYKDKNGKITSSQLAFRNDEANKRMARFDGTMQSILRDLGSYDNAEGGAKLVTRIQNWDQFNQKYSASLQNLSSAIKYDVTNSIRKVTEYCFKESKTWKNQQMASANSPYRNKKNEIEANTVKLKTSLDSGLNSLNADYSEVMATLGGKHVALNRASCQNGLDNMSNCYKSIQRNITDLLEGNSSSANTLTTKEISGGAKVGGFKVACNGINGCITNLKQVRDVQVKAISSITSQRADWVRKGNAALMQAASGFASRNLADLQKRVTDSYALIKKKLAESGVAKAPVGPKYIQGKPLRQAEGSNGEKGPYEAPDGGMGAVFAGLLPPPGLINMEDNGLEAGRDLAITKFNEDEKKNREEQIKIGAAFDKFSKLKSEIGGGCGGTIKNIADANKEVNSVLCENCNAQVTTCRTALAKLSTSNAAALAKWKTDSAEFIKCSRISNKDCFNPGPSPAPDTNKYSDLDDQLKGIYRAISNFKNGTSTSLTEKDVTVNSLPLQEGCTDIDDKCSIQCVDQVKSFVAKKAEESKPEAKKAGQ